MDKKVITSLEELFEFAEPHSLRRSLNHVFFNFLLNNKNSLPQDFDTITEDFYFLIDFLEKADLKTETNSP
ncbi:hypothetical protein CNR22_19105 [Sphingobacteriaceae bacterium]|nr:hypothetical protein CNR22_19105 [Sphingobacteriaceae bacterium]